MRTTGITPHVVGTPDEGPTGGGETRMLGVEDLVRRMEYGNFGRAGEIVM